MMNFFNVSIVKMFKKKQFFCSNCLRQLFFSCNALFVVKDLRLMIIIKLQSVIIKFKLIGSQ